MLDMACIPASELDALVRRLDLVDPTDPSVTRILRPAPRLPTLADKRVGLLDNRKPNAAELLAALADLLRARSGIAEAAPRSKFIYSRPAAPDLIDELAGCDAVITAIGD